MVEKRVLIIPLVLFILFVGCSAVKIVKTDDVFAIRKEVTTKKMVVKKLGKPLKIRGNEYIYLYENRLALKGEIYRQETRITFDSSDIVERVLFIEKVMGEGLYDILKVQQGLMPIRVGTIVSDSVKNRIYPSMVTNYYENGQKMHSSFTFRTAEGESRALATSSHIQSQRNKEGYFSYIIYFSPDGMLRKKLK